MSDNFVTSELKLLITKRMLFTDSECVLHWIKATKQLPVFIQNWMDEIQKEEYLIFGYVSSVQNPADFTTKGLSALEIIVGVSFGGMKQTGCSMMNQSSLHQTYRILHQRK